MGSNTALTTENDFVPVVGVTAEIEQVILDHAAQVLNRVQVRRDHPSFGVTKTAITAVYEQMEGMIGLYMVLNRQAFHANVPGTAIFQDAVVASRVNEARRAWQEL